MLLRFNSNLKSWYKLYTTKHDHEFEEGFCMTMGHFWKLMKDIKVMNHKLTIPSFNRLYLQGARNGFELKCDIDRLVRDITVEKSEHFR